MNEERQKRALASNERLTREFAPLLAEPSGYHRVAGYRLVTSNLQLEPPLAPAAAPVRQEGRRGGLCPVKGG
jgi:hypothetical protein